MKAEDAFLQLFKKLMPRVVSTTIGIVTNVDKNNNTCDVKRDGQPDLFNCRLNAVVDTYESYVVAYPKLGSYVLCLTLDETDCLVIATSTLESASIKIGNSTIVINTENVVINDGTLGGLVKIEELTKQLNILLNAFNTHTHTVASAPGTVAPILQPLAQFRVSDYENKRIKQ